MVFETIEAACLFSAFLMPQSRKWRRDIHRTFDLRDRHEFYVSLPSSHVSWALVSCLSRLQELNQSTVVHVLR